jgi:hypothetical protein
VAPLPSTKDQVVALAQYVGWDISWAWIYHAPKESHEKILLCS